MKKRLLAVIAAMTMVLSMGMTAFAANSPVIDDDNDVPSGYVDNATADIGGQSVKLTVEASTAAMYSNANAAQQSALDAIGVDVTAETISMKAMADLIKNVGGYTYTSASYRDWFDLSLPAGQTIPAGGIKVALETSSVQAGDIIVVLHLNANGQWENIPVEVVDGKVIGTFTSFSPVFVFKLEGAVKATADTPATADTTTATTETKNATTTKAPKTGEVGGVYVAGMLALISAAGIVVYTRKQKVVR